MFILTFFSMYGIIYLSHIKGGITLSSSLPVIQFIWDYRMIKYCEKISEDTITLEQIRKSAGMETNTITGERFYFVPAPEKFDFSV